MSNRHLTIPYPVLQASNARPPPPPRPTSLHPNIHTPPPAIYTPTSLALCIQYNNKHSTIIRALHLTLPRRQLLRNLLGLLPRLPRIHRQPCAFLRLLRRTNAVRREEDERLAVQGAGGEMRFVGDEVVDCGFAWCETGFYADEVREVVACETVHARFLVVQIAEGARHAHAADAGDAGAVVDFAAGIFYAPFLERAVGCVFFAESFDVPAAGADAGVDARGRLW